MVLCGCDICEVYLSFNSEVDQTKNGTRLTSRICNGRWKRFSGPVRGPI
jgi:hypothetical protein